MAKSEKSSGRRLRAIMLIFTVLILLLIIRVFWLQIVKGSWYQKAVSAQQFRNQVISPSRGKILDRNGNELAYNLPVVTITADPSQIQMSKVKTGEIVQSLSEILAMDRTELDKVLQQTGHYALVKRKVDKDTGEKIRKWINEKGIVGIFINQDTKRYYPNKKLAAHVIGFTGADNQGLNGIELVMEQYLKGKPGKLLYESDAGGNGTPLGKENRIDAQEGLNVLLTIDENIQNITEKALQKAIEDNKVLRGATAIVLDPKTSEILAMVSKPDFDLNDPYAAPAGVTGLDTGKWNEMKSEDRVKKLQETVWRNKAVNSTYEPGSTFKVVTAAAGLEDGIVTPESDVIDAPIIVSGWTINCWYLPGHGREKFKESMYNSCNPVFVKLAQSMGIDRFYQYVNAFGFYDKTGIDLPGEANSIIHKKPTEIDMATASFGQSFQITPIQMITAYGAVANGGKLLRPHLVKELKDSADNEVKKYEPEVVRNVISKQTSDTLRDILEGVVSKGTGINAYVKGYRVAGKTATSQTFENGVRSKDKYIAAFSAFAPADNPAICVLVVLDDPSLDSHSGGVVAGPVAARIIEESLGYLGVEKSDQ